MKKNKEVIRSIRISKELKDEAKKQGLNLNQFINLKLEEYLNGVKTCPCCNRKIS